MSDYPAFLAAVDAAPEDHTLRLVLADWLDETGQPAAADGWRWLAAKARVPVFLTLANSTGQDAIFLDRWNWFVSTAGVPFDDAKLPRAFFEGDSGDRVHAAYPTASAVMAAAVGRWVEMTPARRAEYWAWQPPG